MRVIDSPQVSDYRETTALAVAVHVMQIDIKRTRTQFQNIAKNVFINTDDFSDRRPLFNGK